MRIKPCIGTVFRRDTFTGKENDEETGYGYFGARYMDHELMTMWLSVDPMADKYPSISPYAYCAWNPVRLVDPNGEDIYEISITGQINKICESDQDAFHIVDENGNRMGGKSLKYDRKVVNGEIELLDEKNGNIITYIQIDDDEVAREMFSFVSDACRSKSAEFGWAKVLEDDNCATNLIGFGSQNESKTSANRVLFNAGYNILSFTHNHPDGLMTASSSDVKFATIVQEKFPQATFNVYRIDGTLFPYDCNTPVPTNELKPVKVTQ